jgi:hypothetical protein
LVLLAWLSVGGIALEGSSAVTIREKDSLTAMTETDCGALQQQ